MPRSNLPTILVAILAGLFFVFLFSPSIIFAEWKTLAPGFDYQTPPNSSVHLFRVDPKKFGFDLLLASDYGASALTGIRYRERSGALLVINGGFFDEGFRSLGLLRRQGQMINPTRHPSWGIFLLGGKEGKGPAIVPPKDWKPDGVVMAIQVGPRLLVGGEAPTFKESEPSRRSALGITPDHLVVIALSHAPILLKDWAAALQPYCIDALNLDGGGSSQISVRLPNFSLEIPGSTGIPNAVAVLPR